MVDTLLSVGAVKEFRHILNQFYRFESVLFLDEVDHARFLHLLATGTICGLLTRAVVSVDLRLDLSVSCIGSLLEAAVVP